MTRLKTSWHASRGLVVEVWDDDRGLLATIYPIEGGVKIVSEYFAGRVEQFVELDAAFPPALEVLIP